MIANIDYRIKTHRTILAPDDIGFVASGDIGFWVYKSYVIKLRLSPKKNSVWILEDDIGLWAHNCTADAGEHSKKKEKKGNLQKSWSCASNHRVHLSDDIGSAVYFFPVMFQRHNSKKQRLTAYKRMMR